MIGNGSREITLSEMNNSIQNIDLAEIGTVTVLINAHADRRYKDSKKEAIKIGKEFLRVNRFFITNIFRAFASDRVTLEDLFPPLEKPKKTTKKELIRHHQDIIDKRTYKEEELQESLIIGFTQTYQKKPVYFKNIVNTLKSKFYEKNVNVIVNSCYNAQALKIGPKLYQSATFISFGQANQPIWAYDLNRYFESFSFKKQYYNGRVTAKKFVYHFLANCYGVKSSLPNSLQFSPKVALQNKIVNPEQLVVFGKDIPKWQEQHIMNELDLLLSRETLLKTIHKLEKMKNMTLSDVKKKLKPTEFGHAMLIGLVINNSL